MDLEKSVKDMLSGNADDAWCNDTPATRSLGGKTVEIKSPTGKYIGLFRMHIREVGEDGSRKEGHIQIGLEPVDTDAVCSTIAALQPFKQAVLDKGSGQIV